MKRIVVILLISVFICTALVYGQTNDQLTNEQKA